MPEARHGVPRQPKWVSAPLWKLAGDAGRECDADGCTGQRRGV